MPSSTFALPADHIAKSDPALTGADDHHFDTIAPTLEETRQELTERLRQARHATGVEGQEALDRDQEVRRLSSRLRTLQRYERDLCLGRMVTRDGTRIYVGRLGLADRSGRRLLIDWRSPAAEPFFAATHADPMGLVSRRRYRWAAGLITDYWDEAFSDAAVTPALDPDSAFIASLGAARTDRMQDVLSTLQSDQHAIIRASSTGTLVVDGGPGTGKTVVALHRAAYLLHADPRLREGRGGVLVVGPHRPYLRWVADVLPGLGEEGVLACTLADLVPGGGARDPEPDPEVARLKASAALVGAIDRAVAIYEEPPVAGLEVSTPWADVWVGPADWVEAFDAPDPTTPHNAAREEVWDALLDVLVDKLEEVEDVAEETLRRALRRSPELIEAVHGAWPMLEHTDVVADLWAVPAYLRLCAGWLSPDEARLLRRPEGSAWTVADLPLLDAARRRLGDPDVSRLRRRRELAAEAERDDRAAVVDDLIRSDDSTMQVMSMLRGQDLREALVDPDATALPPPDGLVGPFAHVIVDEAQELSDAEWQMLIARCPSRSFTVVGDRAQARDGFTETWSERLGRVGLDRLDQVRLTINYRTPTEIMAEAEPVIRAFLPDANVPTSVRSSGVPVRHGRADALDAVLDEWLTTHPEGTACVLGSPQPATTRPRVRSLTPALAKGLEFDLVVLLDPASLGSGLAGAVDTYVAMTRSTGELVILT
ncbi:RNA polymerase recycling motor ATPase HelR [Nocardioides caeni]|uniref:RNA polymerase recycling motor ATPase HelR n=1 Tax=Nocardioides caeni TaxID=574700 RepID=UPI001EE95B92|nr:RNA polymerase recycling motor ATPase HelR [Nocardioides caeni]